MTTLVDKLEASKRHATNQRDNWKRRALAYESAIRKTLEENAHLADGDQCTLIALVRVLKEHEVTQPQPKRSIEP